MQHGIGSYAAVVPAALMFFLLLGGFAVKLPVFPFHTWFAGCPYRCADGGQRCTGRRFAKKWAVMG